MNLKFEKIAIIYNSQIEGAFDLAQKLKKKFSNSEIFELSKMPKGADFVIVVGGDGTLLKCARFYCGSETAIFGFNMGRLGYLAQALPDEVDIVVEKILAQDFRIENRIMLNCSSSKTVALNDIVVRGANCSRTSTFNLFINDTKLCSYLADGLIVSTPTGSTAYSLSAGGPIVSPLLDCFVVVPICPHTLNARPIVIPSGEKIKITTNEHPKEFQVTSDGQDNVAVNDEILIEKYSKPAKLLLLNSDDKDFYDVLREKLHWGIAPKKR